MTYDTETPINEPIEIRLDGYNGSRTVYLGTVNERGAINHAYGNAGGLAESLSNVQSSLTYPRKAVPGWQAEMVAFFNAGLSTVAEIR